MTPIERRNLMINFKGFGNPAGDRKVCFVGIEEADGFSEVPTVLLDQSIIENYQNEIKIELPGNYEEYRTNWNIEHPGRRHSKVYEYMAKFINYLKPDLPEIDILNEYLFTQNGLAFQMNLFPIGRQNNLDINADFTDPERFGFNSFEEYRSIVINERYRLLREFWENHRENFALTICFSIEYWDDYRNLFGLNLNADIRDINYEYYRNERVLLTRFFKSGNGGLNNNVLLELKNLLLREQINL